jgi:hypothetical protein
VLLTVLQTKQYILKTLFLQDLQIKPLELYIAILGVSCTSDSYGADIKFLEMLMVLSYDFTFFPMEGINAGYLADSTGFMTGFFQ